MGLGPLWTLKAPPSFEDRPDDQDRGATVAAMNGDELIAAVTTCRACPLCETRTHAVFGEGPETPAWLVIGAAPSRDDDLAGAPLTGQPGRLLDAMLASIALTRQRDVFVTTAVKCRPPNDRDPLPAELAACRPYLDRQVALLMPRRMLVLGPAAARAVSTPSGLTRGEAHVVVAGEHEVPAIATHDPSRLLAEPLLKAEAWADLCIARSS